MNKDVVNADYELSLYLREGNVPLRENKKMKRNSLLKLGVAVDVKQSDKLLPVKSEWASYNRLRYRAFVSHN